MSDSKVKSLLLVTLVNTERLHAHLMIIYQNTSTLNPLSFTIKMLLYVLISNVIKTTDQTNPPKYQYISLELTLMFQYDIGI